ncbi:unnamed protein product [Blepharisma stoltei]|uniref:Uncharacterized protein n=1 Tax=Blepharisma stoltei TaxID=1481888 RepID=A0AAU9K8I8_9CILI|nr:unnamed protein product [Blepharisma stoltei]
MQNFEALKKPCKPGEVFSPPRSPKPENTSLILTPEFSQPSPSAYASHRRAYSRESPQGQKGLIEHFAKENKRLAQRIMQLEQIQEDILTEHQKLLHQYNDELKQKIIKWEGTIKEKDKYIKELEREIENLHRENDSLKGSPSKYKIYKADRILECEQVLVRNLENLSRITEDNAEIDGFIADELFALEQEEYAGQGEEGYEVSAIQEEGRVMSLGQTEVEPACMLESFENTIEFKNSKFMSSLTSVQLEDIDIPYIGYPMSPQSAEIMLLHKIRDKDEEIARHKEFIKKLKNSLESMLQEHTKSRIEMVKNKQEIQELREKLGLTMPRENNCKD